MAAVLRENIIRPPVCLSFNTPLQLKNRGPQHQKKKWSQPKLELLDGIQDWNNLKAERSLSSRDVPRRLVIGYVLDLPFGHGKKCGAGLKGFSGAVVSGWGVDGITTLQRLPGQDQLGKGDALTSAGFGVGSLR